MEVALTGTSVGDTARLGAGGRLVLSGDDTLRGRVQRLVEAESSCCSFFSFQLVPLAKAVWPAPAEAGMALDIEVPSTRVQVLDGLVRRAGTARRRGSWPPWPRTGGAEPCPIAFDSITPQGSG